MTVHAARLLVLLTLASGCLSATPLPPDAAWTPPDPATWTFLDTDHDHKDPALHEAALNLSLVAHVAEGTNTYAEFDAVGKLGVLAVHGPPAGLLLIDLSDLDHPSIIGRFYAPGTMAWDARLSPDGTLAFLAVANHPPFYPNAQQEAPRNPLGAAQGVKDDGVYVFDATARATMTPLSFYPVPDSGVHMLNPHQAGSALYVYSANPSYTYEGIALRAVEAVDIARWDPLTKQLVHAATYRPPTLSPLFTVPHDVMTYRDPVLGDLLITSFQTTQIASLADPEKPRHMVEVPKAPGHSARIFWVDGHRILVADTEPFSGVRQGPLEFFDATDLQAVKHLGNWSIPGEDRPYECCYRFAAHNFEHDNGTLNIAHYHGGVWRLDVSTWDRVQSPRLLGFYAPNAGKPQGAATVDAQVPNVWDVVPFQGRLFASDIGTGLYELRPIEAH
jgi:hypothetical protein